MKNKIIITYGGPKAEFKVSELINYYRSQNVDYLIIGNNHVKLIDHKKPHSLDVWLRNHHSVKSNYKNTCQATNKVIIQLLKSKQFSLGKRKCPITNRMCNSLILK